MGTWDQRHPQCFATLLGGAFWKLTKFRMFALHFFQSSRCCQEHWRIKDMQSKFSLIKVKVLLAAGL